MSESERVASGRISPGALIEIQTASREYYAAVATSDLNLSSQVMYVDAADRFIRWLKGDFDPAARKEAHRVVKTTNAAINGVEDNRKVEDEKGD